MSQPVYLSAGPGLCSSLTRTLECYKVIAVPEKLAPVVAEWIELDSSALKRDRPSRQCMGFARPESPYTNKDDQWSSLVLFCAERGVPSSDTLALKELSKQFEGDVYLGFEAVSAPVARELLHKFKREVLAYIEWHLDALFTAWRKALEKLIADNATNAGLIEHMKCCPHDGDVWRRWVTAQNYWQQLKIPECHEVLPDFYFFYEIPHTAEGHKLLVDLMVESGHRPDCDDVVSHKKWMVDKTSQWA